ncbi:hypothetical protein GCM10027088_45000 [Nocardia goodfellowii]|uniref:Uncharacterized protein n=1 Tax=Nocardia goodfellowii TaxID=882446 RepID=A0ABS4QIU0_9NOCA|nr:hypothetical protein [Nocardia goodfellowii]
MRDRGMLRAAPGNVPTRLEFLMPDHLPDPFVAVYPKLAAGLRSRNLFIPGAIRVN